MDARFHRLALMIGPEGVARLQRARITIVGLGAVGSYATEALARAGVGYLRLIDHDIITPSNVNRQLFALTSTFGQPKATVAAARVREINPACDVEALKLFVNKDTLEEIFSAASDLIVDAIDAFGPKLALLAAALERQAPILSSMGAALRTDPEQICVGWLAEARGCPLAARLRHALRKRGLEPLVRCVYSEEPVERRRIAEIPCPAGFSELESVGPGRPRRPLGSLPTITGIFGLRLAHEALRQLLGGF